MATQNKPVLGYRYCPICDERGTIHQAGGKRSSSLYQRCGCGCLQGNGKWMQSQFWYETEWLEGLRPEMPVNVYPEEKYQERFGGQQAEPEQDTTVEKGALGSHVEAGPGEAETSPGEVDAEDLLTGEDAEKADRLAGKVKRAGLAFGLFAVGVAVLRGMAGGS